MLTNKNWVRSKSALFLAATLLLAACAPPGPRALLAGKRLLEQGKYAEAIERLKTATVLLATNAPPADAAQAWNYLGVAYHQAGQPAEAERAYLRAQALDHDLTEAHYNLGCLWLEQNRIEGARSEFMTYTLRRSYAVEGFLKLGTAEWRASEAGSAAARTKSLNAAENTFKEALKLSPQNAEALNGLGLVRLSHNQANEAAQYFSSALRQQPGFAPALLNLAIVAQHHLNQPQLAAQKYREYLALKPVPANAEAVRGVLRQLEQESGPARSAEGSSAPAGQGPSNVPPARSGPVAAAPKSPVLPASKREAGPASNPSAPTQAVEEVKLANEPVLKVAEDAPSGATSGPVAATDNTRGSATPAGAGADTGASKRSLLQRLFGHSETPANHATASGGTTNPALAVATTHAAPEAELPALPAPLGARYTYKAPAKPTAGNRTEAQRAFARAVQAQGARRWSEAIKDYRAATQLDPSFFDAYYNLGLAAGQAGELRTALTASEAALAIHPESRDARYNFALALRQANYLTDAANELEKLLAYNPSEARAHLALANLYAQQLRQPSLARAHYQRVLELDPHNKQADNIRYWLVQNR